MTETESARRRRKLTRNIDLFAGLGAAAYVQARRATVRELRDAWVTLWFSRALKVADLLRLRDGSDHDTARDQAYGYVVALGERRFNAEKSSAAPAA